MCVCVCVGVSSCVRAKMRCSCVSMCAALAPSQINRMRLKFYTNSFRSVRFALGFPFPFPPFYFLVLSFVVFPIVFYGAWRQLNELLFIVLEDMCVCVNAKNLHL